MTQQTDELIAKTTIVAALLLSAAATILGIMLGHAPSLETEGDLLQTPAGGRLRSHDLPRDVRGVTYHGEEWLECLSCNEGFMGLLAEHTCDWCRHGPLCAGCLSIRNHDPCMEHFCL